MNTNQTGSGIVGTLTLIFIVLKLTGAINWSWGWVFSPVWITLLISIAMITYIALTNK